MVILLFCAALLSCLLCGFSLLYALTFGLVLFLLHGRRRGFSWRELFRMALAGIKTVRTILIAFVLIGMMTALWRSAGTIPVLVCYAAALIRPAVFVLMTFLLNCLLSFLMGSSFGTSATMGVICAAMGAAMGVDVRVVGGAVLSGVYFGDRCSPVSTSALLVADLTGTDIFNNIRRMMKSAFVPFLLSAGIYLALGFVFSGSGETQDLRALFGKEFALHPLALLPALAILALSLFRVPVRQAMGASILCAIPLCLFLQHRTAAELVKTAIFGFHAASGEVAAMLDGGGILSMLEVGGIVCLSGSYSVIFQKTGLLDGVRQRLEKLAGRLGSYAVTLLTSIVACAVTCNQSFSTILCSQLCGGLYGERSDLALDLDDSVVLVAAAIPWSIACSVPLTMIGAPASAVAFACYLYLIPLWRLACSFFGPKRRK